MVNVRAACQLGSAIGTAIALRFYNSVYVRLIITAIRSVLPSSPSARRPQRPFWISIVPNSIVLAQAICIFLSIIPPRLAPIFSVSRVINGRLRFKSFFVSRVICGIGSAFFFKIVRAPHRRSAKVGIAIFIIPATLACLRVALDQSFHPRVRCCRSCRSPTVIAPIACSIFRLVFAGAFFAQHDGNGLLLALDLGSRLAARMELASFPF